MFSKLSVLLNRKEAEYEAGCGGDWSLIISTDIGLLHSPNVVFEKQGQVSVDKLCVCKNHFHPAHPTLWLGQ